MTTGARIHPSASLGPDVAVAEGACIGPNCYVEGPVSIGAGARLVAGVTLVGEVRVGPGCVIEANVSTTALLPADRRPAPLVVGAGARIGAGSVLACGVTIGPDARIGAGTVVERDVPAHAVVAGNPARIVGYAAPPAFGDAGPFEGSGDASGMVVAHSAVRGVRIHRFPRVRDLRGDLSVGEFGREVPFQPRRYFLVFDVPSAETRGEHAHRTCAQFLVCVGGRVAVVVDDGARREEIELAAPDVGLYIPPRTWALQHRYTPTAALLVFASHAYDPADYIRDYPTFLRECASPR